MKLPRKTLVRLHGEIQRPPFSASAMLEAGRLLRRVQAGLEVVMPHSRPMPQIAARCHELRIVDENHTWRIVYRIDANEVVLAESSARKRLERRREW